MPLEVLDLPGCSNLKDLALPAECKELQVLAIPAQCKGKSIECLRNLPNLKHLDYKWDWDLFKMSAVEEFWKKHGGAAPVKKRTQKLWGPPRRTVGRTDGNGARCPTGGQASH
ncbi:MAG: hypothetical protein HY360_02665, partial [Verrucomicrobia bacterium]|nr:hypothetical protein [Verrucomicrobiota bacterium]